MTKLDDYIVLIKGGMTGALCDAIIGEYYDCNLWESAKISKDGILDESERKVDEISISSDFVISQNSKKRQELDRYIYATVGTALDSYREKFAGVCAEEDTGYNLLRYKESYHYKEHVDSVGQQLYREVSCSIALNSGYDGGEFAFFGGEKIYALEKGDILMFPSNFMYPHAVLPVTKGERISIVTWFR